MSKEKLEESDETFTESTDASLNSNRSEILCNGNEASVIKDGRHYNKNKVLALKSQGIPLLLTKINVDTTTNLKPVCSPRDNSIKKKYVMLVKKDCIPGQNAITNDNEQMFILLPYKIQENISTNLNPVSVLGENSTNVKLMKGNWIPEQDNFINDNIDNGVVNNNKLIKQKAENRGINLNLIPVGPINKKNNYASSVPCEQDDGIVDTTFESIYHQNNILPFQPNDNLDIPKEICQSKKKPKFRKLYNIDDYDENAFPEKVYVRPEHKSASHLEFKTQLDFNCTLHKHCHKRTGSNSTLNSKVESALHDYSSNIIKTKQKLENSTLQRKGVVRNRRYTKIEPNIEQHIIETFTRKVKKLKEATLKKNIKKKKNLI